MILGNTTLGAVRIVKTNTKLISLGNGYDDRISASLFYALLESGKSSRLYLWVLKFSLQ